MLVNALAENCSVDDKASFGIDMFDLAAFLKSDIPALCINHPAATVFVIIAEDGSVAMVEHGRMTEEFEGLRIEGEAVLRDAAAQDLVRDFQAGPAEMHVLVAILGAAVPDHALLSASAGARRKLGIDSDASLEDLAAAARAAGGDADRVNAMLDAFGAGLSQPLFVPDEVSSWSAEARDEIEDILTDILHTDDRYDGEWFDLTSADDETPASLEVDADDGDAISRRAMAILHRLVDFDQDFHGHSYDYNDGAAGRRSGYCRVSARIVAGDIDPCSNHERMAAIGRLRVRLAAKGLDAAEIETLVRT